MPVRCPNRHTTSKSISCISDAVYRATTDTQSAPLHFLHLRSLVSASSGRRCYSRSGEAKTATAPGERLERCRSTPLASHQRRAASNAAIDDTDPYSPESSADIQDERNEATPGSLAAAHGRARTGRRHNPISEKARNDLQQMVETLQNMTKDPDPRIIHRESDALHYYRLPISPVVRRKRVPKPQRKPKPSEGQRALNSDPWAQILASPVRHCTGSGARLPIALLTNWGFMRHPDDNKKVYVMPYGLVDGIKDLETMGQGLLERKAKQRDLSRGDDDADNVEQPRADEKPSENRTGLREITSTTRKGNAPAIRILPYYNLLRQLNTQFTKQVDPTDPSSREARPGQAALLVPTLWKFRLDEVRHYEAHRRELAAQTGLADLRPSNEEATIDIKKLNWRTDAPSKVLDVIRQRVAAALKRVIEMNSSGLSTKRRDISVLPPAILERDGILSDQDIAHSEISQIATLEEGVKGEDREHGGLESDNVGSSDEATAQRMSTEYAAVHTPRTFLYFGPQPSAKFDHLLSLPSTPPLASTLANAVSVAELMPPRLAASSSGLHSISSPIFPLRLLLGESLYATFLENVQAQDHLFQHPAFSDAHPPDAGQRPEEFVLCLKASAHFADVLVREVWQLWRYVGGRRALGTGRKNEEWRGWTE